MAKKKDLNVGIVGYGFMGRTHSNAFLQARRFFDHRPAGHRWQLAGRSEP